MDKFMPLSRDITKSVPSLLLIICLVGLPQLSETIYSPSLPAITTSLGTSSHLVQWTLSIYFIGFALGVGFWGKLSDHIGRRPAMLAGLLIYLIMSLCCGATTSIYALLSARLFQAFGISVGSVVTQSIMRDCFTGIERSRIFSTAGMAIALAPAIGPLIGGLLTQNYLWRANFFFLSLLGLLLVIYAFYALPETNPNFMSAAKKDDKKSSSYLVLAKRMLVDKHVIASSLLVGGFNGILFSYYSEAPYIFIGIFKLQPIKYGMLGIFMAAGVCVGSFISRRINQYMDGSKVIKYSCYIVLLLMSLFTLGVYLQLISSKSEYSIFIIMILMMLFYINFGISIPNILSNALVSYQNDVGAASSLFGIIYYVWVAIFVFGIGSFLPNSLLTMPLYFLAISILMVFSAKRITIK
jgi:Bcr/CflA subfamily drug resistance transporter